MRGSLSHIAGSLEVGHLEQAQHSKAVRDLGLHFLSAMPALEGCLLTLCPPPHGHKMAASSSRSKQEERIKEERIKDEGRAFLKKVSLTTIMSHVC